MSFGREKEKIEPRIPRVLNPGFLTDAVCDTIHGLTSGGYSLFPIAKLNCKNLVRTEIGLVASLIRIVVICAAVVAVAFSNTTRAQFNVAAEGLLKASAMFPEETEAFVCLPNSEVFLDNWGETELGKFAADQQLQDFWTSQQATIKKRFSELGWEVSIQFEDLTNICSGQAAIGWISRTSIAEKPFSLGVVIDVRGKDSQVDELLARIEKEMGELKAKSDDIGLGDLKVRHYTFPKTNADKRVRESFYVVSAGQLFAADDLITIEQFLQAQKSLPERSLSNSSLYKRVHERILRDNHEAELEYFVRPLGFARLLRTVSAKSPRGQIDMIKLLSEQGFESLLCAAGSVQFNKEDLDMHHQGFILREEEVPESVQILDFPNQEALTPPRWIDPKSASVLGVSWNFSEAFPKFKGLVDAYIGEAQFDEILEGMKEDPNGPQIDIKEEILPYVGTQFFAVTEIVPPITPESKRSLICVKLKDPDNKLKGVLDRFSKSEPGASIEDVGDYRIWKFDTEEVKEDVLDFDAGPGSKGGNKAAEEEQPLLKQWAVTLIDGWFVFASNPESLTEVIERAGQSELDGVFEELPEVQAVRAMQKKLLDGAEMSFSEVDFSERSFEMQYELFRQNILPQSRSLLALIAERLLKTDKAKQQQLQGGNLPPFEVVKHFFTPAGMVVRTEKDGWGFDSFILGKKHVPEPSSETNE